MNVGHVDGTSKQRRDFSGSEASNAATDTGDQEGQFGVLFGKGYELIDIGRYGVHATLHRGDSVALALQTDALPHNGTEFFYGDAGCAASMCTGKVAAKDKDLVTAERVDTV